MNEPDLSKKSKRFHVFHWNGKDLVDDDGLSIKDYHPQPSGTPQEIAQHRGQLRHRSLCKAMDHFGWSGMVGIWLAVSVACTLDWIYRPVHRVLKRNDYEDPTWRDVIALGLLELVPCMPRWLYWRMEAWDEWRLKYGLPSEYRRPVKLEQPPRASGERSSGTPPSEPEAHIHLL